MTLHNPSQFINKRRKMGASIQKMFCPPKIWSSSITKAEKEEGEPSTRQPKYLFWNGRMLLGGQEPIVGGSSV